MKPPPAEAWVIYHQGKVVSARSTEPYARLAKYGDEKVARYVLADEPAPESEPKPKKRISGRKHGGRK